MNALAAMCLLHKKSDKFYNSNEASEYLVEGKKNYNSGLEHTNHTWNSWNDLTKIIVEGKEHIGILINEIIFCWIKLVE